MEISSRLMTGSMEKREAPLKISSFQKFMVGLEVAPVTLRDTEVPHSPPSQQKPQRTYRKDNGDETEGLPVGLSRGLVLKNTQ